MPVPKFKVRANIPGEAGDAILTVKQTERLSAKWNMDFWRGGSGRNH